MSLREIARCRIAPVGKGPADVAFVVVPLRL
jgi:hypothetical protein